MIEAGKSSNIKVAQGKGVNRSVVIKVTFKIIKPIGLGWIELVVIPFLFSFFFFKNPILVWI